MSSSAKTWRTKLCAMLTLSLLFSVTRAQKPAKTTSPPAVEQTDTIRINTSLLQVDVLVRDEQGRAVTDLRAEDFVIVDNGRAYPAEYCSYVNLVNERAPLSAEAGERLSRNELGRTIAFIVAIPIIDANVIITPPGGATAVGATGAAAGRTSASASNRGVTAVDANTIRHLLTQFAGQQIGARDLVAIHSTERNMGVLGNFTSDRDVLRQAIEEVTKPAPRESWVRAVVTRDSIDGNLVEQNLAVVKTLSDAIEQVQALPGRKLVVLVSRGFFISPRLANSSRVRDRLRELTAQANRAGVAIYTLNPRGIGLLSNGVVQDMDSLIALSNETGGKALYNTNDLSIGFGEIIKENAGYYLLGYPLADNDDPNKPHKLKVQVRRPNLKVQSRQTIYSSTRLFKPNETTEQNDLTVALNTPFALRDLNVSVTPKFHSPDGKALLITSFVNVAPSGLTLEPQANGSSAVALELAVQVTGPERKVIKQETKTLNLTLAAESLKTVEQQGLPLGFAVEAPTPGAMQVNVAVRDTRSGRIGNASRVLEVADLNGDKLMASSLFLYAANATGADALPKQQFTAGGRLRYECFVYHARRAEADHATRLQVTLRLRRGDQLISENKNTAMTQATGAIVPLNGEMLLPAVQPGLYRLELAIEDLLHKGAEHTVSTMVRVVE